MRASARMSGLAAVLDDGLAMMERATTAGMREATIGLKEELRDQVFAAGLGNRLAKTWQGNVYPKSGVSLEPAGFIFSKAPKIISLHATGGTIRPVNGSNYLWIPSDNVPQRRGRGGKGPMSPQEVENHFNADIYVRRGKNGRYLAFIDVVRGLSRRRPGYRQATKGRLRQGRAAQPVLMFTLARAVNVRKRLDIEGPARRWGARIPSLIEKNWSN